MAVALIAATVPLSTSAEARLAAGALIGGALAAPYYGGYYAYDPGYYGYYAPAYYAPPVWGGPGWGWGGRPWGWHRHWRHWHRW
jgi:hypothetical protein